MSEAFDIRGHCLCGAVEFTAKANSHDVSVCHCSMCSRWAGGIAMYLEVAGAPLFEGTDNLAIFRSSEWGERGFCRVCGSSLFWKVAGKDHYMLSSGAIADQSTLKLATEIFIEDKPAYYDFANDTLKQSGEEAMVPFIGEGRIGR